MAVSGATEQAICASARYNQHAGIRRVAERDEPLQNYGGRDIRRRPAELAITVWFRSPFRVIERLMSRGLGKLQRAILTHLRARPGGDPLGNHDPHHTNIVLASGWHDLRRVSREINGGQRGSSCPSKQAAFSRAVSRLLAQKFLISSALVPIVEVRRWDDDRDHWLNMVVELSDGKYLNVRGGRQRRKRFVKIDIDKCYDILS